MEALLLLTALCAAVDPAWMRGGQRINVQGGRAYVASDYYIHFIDVSNVSAPTRLSSYGVDEYSWFSDVRATGDLAYTILDYDFTVLNISNPRRPQPVARMPTLYHALDVVGDVVYLAKWGGEVVILNTSVPNVPVQMGVHALRNQMGNGSLRVDAVHVSGKLMYVMGKESYFDVAANEQKNAHRFEVINVNTPSEPKVLCRLDGEYWDVTVVEDVVYLTGPTGVTIYWVVAEGGGVALHAKGRFAASDAVATAVAAGKAYVGAGSDVLIVDVRAEPLQVGRVPVGDKVKDIHVAGSLCYVVTSGKGMFIYDLSTPTEPRLVGRYEG